MRFESREALAAFFWENPGLKNLVLGNYRGIIPALPASLLYL